MKEVFGPTSTVRILICAETAAFFASCIDELHNDALSTVADVVTTSEELVNRLSAETVYDVVITDARLADKGALQATQWIASNGNEVPVILIADAARDRVVTDCIKAGAADYVLQNDLGRLPIVVRRFVNENRLRSDRDRHPSPPRGPRKRSMRLRKRRGVFASSSPPSKRPIRSARSHSITTRERGLRIDCRNELVAMVNAFLWSEPQK